MTYFADLSEYEYLLREAGEPRALNVGWLEASVPFPTAETDGDFVDLTTSRRIGICCRMRSSEP